MYIIESILNKTKIITEKTLHEWMYSTYFYSMSDNYCFNSNF